MGTNHLSFGQDAVNQLFENNYKINPKKLHALLDQGDEIVPDLLMILDDAINDTALYTDRLQPNEGGFAPSHALYLLREMRREECFDRLKHFLGLEITTFERLLGTPFLLDELWSFVCLFGGSHLEALEDLLTKTDIDIKLGIALGLSQMAVHDPSQSEKVQSIFSKITQQFLEPSNLEKLQDKETIFEDSDYETDIEFISEFARIIMEADFKGFRSDIDELFEYNLIDVDILDPEMVIFKKYEISPNTIFETYKMMSGDLDEDDIHVIDDDDIKPKVKKMKQ